MSFWVITESRQRMSANDAAVIVPAGGLPDLSRALSRDHLREWVLHLQPDALPEKIDEEAEYFWKLIDGIHRDDHIITRINADTLALAEVTGNYQFEADDEGGNHVWPVRWVATDIPLSSFESLRPLLKPRAVKELPDSDTSIQFRKYFPSWKSRGYVIFRWVSVAILIAELVYFWPGK
jgi:predicted Mrr-cat superfamily restriction endonuclease